MFKAKGTKKTCREKVKLEGNGGKCPSEQLFPNRRPLSYPNLTKI